MRTTAVQSVHAHGDYALWGTQAIVSALNGNAKTKVLFIALVVKLFSQ